MSIHAWLNWYDLATRYHHKVTVHMGFLMTGLRATWRVSGGESFREDEKVLRAFTNGMGRGGKGGNL